MKFLSELKRTHYCTELGLSDTDKKVVVMGWVDTRRDHGGLVFVDLRDRTGLLQIVLNPKDPALLESKNFRGEYVIAIQGVVRARPQDMVNKKLPTGEIEIEATLCEILSKAETPPFKINDPKVHENLRLKYRYLDLRSSRLQKNLMLRHKVYQVLREFLNKEKFIEVETPILYKSTPEGARDYLVPSRVNLGQFYALPQSPQTLKQLLMIGGIDRYFQVAKCFRDEDLRADRQPEFSQIDIEMSFVDQGDVMELNEALMRFIWKQVKGVDVGPIPQMTYLEAMNRFGCDKPDLRIPLELTDITELATGCGFKVFDDVSSRGGAIKALAVPGAGGFSRGQMDKLTNLAKSYGAKGLVWIKSNELGELTSPIKKFFEDNKFSEIFSAAGGKNGSAVFMVADDFDITCAALSAIRLHLAKELNLIDTSKDSFLWVIDFPLLEFSAEERRFAARHHPFTMPSDDAVEGLLSGDENRYKDLLAKAYDLVCNGHEIGGGSIRIHKGEIQAAMFKCLGMSAEETEQRFGFFLEALTYGVPPHGGFAWGLDRIVMILSGTDAIRDVIAFPKTAKATDLMAQAPSIVDRDQLQEVGVRLNTQAEKVLEKLDKNQVK